MCCQCSSSFFSSHLAKFTLRSELWFPSWILSVEGDFWCASESISSVQGYTNREMCVRLFLSISGSLGFSAAASSCFICAVSVPCLFRWFPPMLCHHGSSEWEPTSGAEDNWVTISWWCAKTETYGSLKTSQGLYVPHYKYVWHPCYKIFAYIEAQNEFHSFAVLCIVMDDFIPTSRQTEMKPSRNEGQRAVKAPPSMLINPQWVMTFLVIKCLAVTSPPTRLQGRIKDQGVGCL